MGQIINKKRAGFPSTWHCVSGRGEVNIFMNVSRSGFSLIELLITLALMCILSAMLYGFGSGSHQRSQQKLCDR